MEDDFDFLRYLDFGTSNPPLNSSNSATTTAGSFMSSMGGGYGGSLHSNYASPQDSKSSSTSNTGSGSSEWSVSSPSGSNVSFPKSPLFGSMNTSTTSTMPSLFDSSFSWDPVITSNNSTTSSIPSQSISGNSPPFDLSIYGSSSSSSTLSDENNGGGNGIATNNTTGYNNGMSYGSSNVSDNNSAALTQQWQQLLFQQAQLQLQMQLQNGNGVSTSNNNIQPGSSSSNQVSPMPVQQGQFSMPFPQVQAMQQLQQQQQQQQQQQAHQHNQGQFQNINGMNSMQNTPQVQPTAQFQISTEDWSSRLAASNASMPMQPQQQQMPQQQMNTNQNVVPTPSPPASANFGQSQSQSMPVSYMPMHAQQQQQYQPQRSLSPTEVPLNMQAAPKPIAPLPKRESVSVGGTGVAIMPTGAAQHVSSVKNSKIAKTGLKRSYQQVKQEDASDEDSKRQQQQHATATSSSTMSRSQSAETTSGSGNDTKGGEKKTPGGHNAVEQKYRRGINDSLITLREIVPALQHLRVLPGMENAQRKQSQFSLSASVTPAAPSGFVDGVMAPTKLSKQLILVTATDYIKFLQNRRSELEGELDAYKHAILDCVEDPQVVLNLAESRWYPIRMQLLKERENIYQSRVASKEQSKKQAKLERQKNASSRKNDGTSAGQGDAGDGGSDDDDDEDDDDDDDEMDGQEMATSSAVPGKGQAKARGRKPAQNKKASSPRKKANTSSAAASRPNGANTSNNDGSKALMSVFAGVSFVGGAGYDILFGSSAAASSSASESVSPSQVWSRGSILRRGITTPLPIPVENTQDLPFLQAFFLRRPALLSGLVMLSLAMIVGYISFYVIPALWKRVNGSAQEARKARARETLIQKTKMPASVDVEEEVQALSTLSGAPTGLVTQTLSLPLLISNFIISFIFGGLPSHFDINEEYDIEEAASAVKLLEMSSESTYFGKMVAFMHLYNLTRSSAWPASKSSIPLLARAQAVLALTSTELFGDRVSKKASTVWKQAQDLLKKEDNSNGWLSFALGSTFEDARKITSKSGNPVFDVAEARAQSILARAWPAVFTEVVNATTFTTSTGFATSSSTSSNVPSSTASKVAEIDTILNAMPPTSQSFALALLAKGIQALGKNDKATAINVALHLAPVHAQSLASVRAFTSLVSGHPEPASFGDAAIAGVDTLAYSTIAWLSIRQIAQASLSTVATSAKKANNETHEAEGEDGEDDSHIITDEAGLQMATIRLRKLLATEAFTNDVDEGFIDAQDRCVEQLVNIGRQAAGLDALSDSGCEL